MDLYKSLNVKLNRSKDKSDEFSLVNLFCQNEKATRPAVILCSVEIRAPLDPELATHCDQSEGGKRHQFWNLWKLCLFLGSPQIVGRQNYFLRMIRFSKNINWIFWSGSELTFMTWSSAFSYHIYLLKLCEMTFLRAAPPHCLMLKLFFFILESLWWCSASDALSQFQLW